MDAPEADADFPMKLFIAAFDGVGARRTCSRRTLGAVALATGPNPNDDADLSSAPSAES